MEKSYESPLEEVARLRRCLNDLLGIMALPALWNSNGPQTIVETMMDALAGTLLPAFVFVHLNAGEAHSPTQMARIVVSQEGLQSAEAIGRALGISLGHSPHGWPSHAHVWLAGVGFAVASARLGANSEIGVVVVGAQRENFPQQAEGLILHVAVNQATMGLQQEKRLSEQKKVTRQLDDRVAERTNELAAAHERLERGERESKLIIDSIPGLIALLSPTGDIDVVNNQVLQYFGQTIEQLRNWRTNETVHPEDLPHAVEVFSRAITSGTPYEVTQRFKRNDGIYRWFQTSGYPLRDSAGKVVKWYVLFTDIDDRKKAEDAVRESERDLKLIIDTIPAFVWCMLPDGSNEFISKGWHEHTGVSPEESKG